MQQTNSNRLPFNPPGKKLGVYRFHNEIGRGNYGAVYLASDDKGNKYAIKSMKKEIFKENGGLIGDLIRNEKNALLQIKNKYVVRIFEYIESVNQAYMVLELCDGGNFEAYLIYKKFQISIYQAVQYFKQIVQGVCALHEKKIIHRDLKLSNILMKENQAQLKIADLGFCHILSENETQVKLNLGTIGTKAPEIILNKPYDASIDMFSTGVIFYQLLCDGNYPFKPYTEEEYLQQILQGPENIVFQKQNEVIPQNIQQLVKQMLHFNPEQRLKWSQILDSFIFKQMPQLETHLGFNSRVEDLKKLQEFYEKNQEILVSIVSPKFADIGDYTFSDETQTLSQQTNGNSNKTVTNGYENLSTISFQNKDEILQIQEENDNIHDLFEKYLSKERYIALFKIVYDLIHKTRHSRIKENLFPLIMLSKKIFDLQSKFIKLIEDGGNVYNSPHYEGLTVTDQWKVLKKEMLENKIWIYEQIQHHIKTFNINFHQKSDMDKLKYIQIEWLEEADVYFLKNNFNKIFELSIGRYIQYLMGDIFQTETDKKLKKVIIIYLIKCIRTNEIHLNEIPIYQPEALLNNKDLDQIFEDSCIQFDNKE